MAPNYQSPSVTTGAPTSHANESVTSPSTHPLNQPEGPVGNGPFPESGQHVPPSPAPEVPPYTERDMEVAGPGSTTPPPPSYAESTLELIIGDAKTPPCVDDSPLPPLYDLPSPHKRDVGGLLSVVSPEEPILLRALCDPYGNNNADNPETTSIIPPRMPICCATTSTLGSKDLNYHVNSDNDVYRWQTTGNLIPVSIDVSSFETHEQGLMAQRCLETVLARFNTRNVGPKFRFVDNPCHSAFFVRFGGDYSKYAQAFFLGSPPKDWYIDVFKPGLTLSAEQEQFLVRIGGGYTARLQALEHNLVKVLTHEMLRIVGVRHCDAQLTEKEICVRFPLDLTDDENNEEHLMQRVLDWRSLSQHDWMDRTIREIQQIYALKEGESIGCHRVRDVSWEVGARQRKEIALRNVRCCGV